MSSVRKNLKLQLSQIVKHAAVAPFISQISTLLTDLGATHSELNKMIPKAIREQAAKMKKEKEEQQLIKPTSKKVCIVKIVNRKIGINKVIDTLWREQKFFWG